jgi:hypothetical protein
VVSEYNIKTHDLTILRNPIDVGDDIKYKYLKIFSHFSVNINALNKNICLKIIFGIYLPVFLGITT